MGAILSSPVVRPVHVVLTRGIWPCKGEEDIRAKESLREDRVLGRELQHKDQKVGPATHTYKSLDRGFRATGMVDGNRMSQLKYMVAQPHLAPACSDTCLRGVTTPLGIYRRTPLIDAVKSRATRHRTPYMSPNMTGSRAVWHWNHLPCCFWHVQ